MQMNCHLSGRMRPGRRSAGSVLFARPRCGDLARGREIVDDQDQSVIMVAVEDFDVDARFGHPSREPAELTGSALVQSLGHDVTLFKDLDARSLERPAR